MANFEVSLLFYFVDELSVPAICVVYSKMDISIREEFNIFNTQIHMSRCMVIYSNGLYVWKNILANPGDSNLASFESETDDP